MVNTPWILLLRMTYRLINTSLGHWELLSELVGVDVAISKHGQQSLDSGGSRESSLAFIT